MKLLLLILTVFSPVFSIAQTPCSGGRDGYEFNANKIQTYFLPQGQKFQSNDHYGFNVPYPGPYYSGEKQTISTGAPWIGGYSDGKLYIATQRYPSTWDYDYYNGPLDTNGVKFTAVCDQFDRVWNVFREDILKHNSDFQQDGKIDDTIANVFGWPAQGNPFFNSFNGFALPVGHHGGWADFFDKNLNGKYDPHLGEYPTVYLKDSLTHPDQIMWMVFNDQGSHLNSNGRPLGVEIQFTVFGYYCQDNDLLNHSLFNKYKIINQSDIILDSLYFGQFHDYEIGCENDDYIGCDSLRNSEFVYNEDNIDGDPDCFSEAYGYGHHTPIQSMTYLSHPMYSFIEETGLQVGQTDIEFYRMMTGIWRNGAPMRVGGNGQSTDPGLPITRYIYHDDPRDPVGWSQLAIGSEQDYKTRTVSSVSLDKLQPGEQVSVECVYIYHQDSTRSHLEQFDVMDANLDMMTEMVLDMDNFCTPFTVCTDEDCVWPGDFNHDLIVDHRDLLYWGVTNGTDGPERNGLINWRGHHAEDWTKNFHNGTNAKHQDADGYGSIDFQDLQHNLSNFSKTTPDYIPHDLYPGGNELAIVSEPMDENGDIGFVRVVSQRPLHDLYGISFELAFDTFFYNYSQLYQSYPLDTLGMCYVADDVSPYYSSYTVDRPGETRYSFVGTNHESFTIPDSFTFMRLPFGLIQKHQIPPEYLPYHIVIRLKNLIGINKEGRELILGADPYIVENPFSTAVGDLEESKIQVYPNPCSDEVMIVSDEWTDVDILSLHGKKVRTISANDLSAPVQVGDLVPGIYFLRFVKTKKIAKLVVH